MNKKTDKRHPAFKELMKEETHLKSFHLTKKNIVKLNDYLHIMKKKGRYKSNSEWLNDVIENLDKV